MMDPSIGASEPLLQEAFLRRSGCVRRVLVPFSVFLGIVLWKQLPSAQPQILEPSIDMAYQMQPAKASPRQAMWPLHQSMVSSRSPRHTQPVQRVPVNPMSTMAQSAHSACVVSAATVPEPIMAPPRPKPTAHDIATGRDPNRVKVFDTTLRDGEQSPGCTMTEKEKMTMAKQLAALGVDIIEAGFPIASPGDFAAVKAIAEEVGTGENPPIICGLARATKKDIEAAAEALKGASFPRIHTFIATSDIHMEHKLRKSREEVIAITKEMVSYAKSFVDDVEFSGEDALRSDPEFLYEVYSTAIEAGATTINIPDTVGYTTPSEFKKLIYGLRTHVRGVQDITISVHGHNDLGLAVANFLFAIEGGARQVECTINGIGERAGNTALEELVMALHVRQNYYKDSAFAGMEMPQLTSIKMDEIAKTSRLVTTLTGMQVQPNKAIVGANAFAHESGIHQDGVLKNRETYEIIDAKTIGLDVDNIVLGKHSGRHAFRTRLNDLGYIMNDDDLNKAFGRFKAVADQKKEITDLDLEAIVTDELRLPSQARYKMAHMQVTCGDGQVPTATLTLHDLKDDVNITQAGVGTGPVDAVYSTIGKIVGGLEGTALLEYTVNSVTSGIDALAQVTVRLQDTSSGRTYLGHGATTDVVASSAVAYLTAVNRFVANRNETTRTHPHFSTPV
eukprot:gnl/TRDRNA2_/TRDRNA2_27944_c0_seq1.p1 gnl/TRDRNA2_/TRDRNA2_27944_c0~~gnl/TRDRNA2_/TRDRNA2_27944_c0_seq1.p1  ORF type:complete len:676 (-),score=140.90 gnl/TRDRNA2_/TRDRNA2_27944_c0_seq1:76-2103(-)